MTSSWVADWGWELLYFVVMSPGVGIPLIALAAGSSKYSFYLTVALGVLLLLFSIALLFFGSFVFLPSAVLLLAAPAVSADRPAPRRSKPTLLAAALVSGVLVLEPTLAECLPTQWELTVILERGATESKTEALGRALTGTDVWSGASPDGVYFFVMNDLSKPDAGKLRRRFERSPAIDRVVQQRDEKCAGTDSEDGL